MKRTYLIALKEVNYGSVTVQAENEEQARERAEAQYYSGSVFWKDTALVMTKIKLEKDRGEER